MPILVVGGISQLNSSRTILNGGQQACPTATRTCNRRLVLTPAPPAGVNLVVNAGFDSSSDWTTYAGVTIDGGVATAAAGAQLLTQAVPLTIGNAYSFSFDYNVAAGGKLRLTNSNINGTNIVYVSPVFSVSAGTFTGSFIALDAWLSIEADSAVYTGTIDNVWIWPSVPVDIEGTSALTFASSGTVTGIGAVTGTAGLTFAPTASLSGKGSLNGSASLTFSHAATLIGKGALTGSSSILFSPSATITGKGALTGSSSIVFSPSATLAGRGAISGSSTLVLSSSGTITGRGALVGGSSLTFAPAGALSGSGALSGAASLSFAASGEIFGRGSVAGSADITFAPAGTLTGVAVLVPLAPRKFVIRAGEQDYFGASRRAYSSSRSRSSRSSGDRSYSRRGR